MFPKQCRLSVARTSFLALTSFFVLCVANQSVAQDTTEKSEKEPAAANPAAKQRNWTDEVSQGASAFQIYADANQAVPLKAVRAYQWANPARMKVQGERLCLLYIHEGRPVASRKIYPTGRSIVHAFISMTDQPIVCRRTPKGEPNNTLGQAAWTPRPVDMKFHKIETIVPRTTVSARRIQMKTIARDFSATTGQIEAERQKATPELRLLPTPLYRYEVKDNGADGLVDGAVFCFVVGGGNPQVLLMVEAVRADGKMFWQYWLSRRTDAALKVSYRDTPTWQTQFVTRGEMDSRGTFFKTNTPVDKP